MTYDEIIEQLEITKSKIKEIARNEYGGESWNDDLDALTEAADIVADYSKATAQAWPRHTARPDPLINGKTPCSRTETATSSGSYWPQRSQLPCCGSLSKEYSSYTTGDPVKEERPPD